MMETEIPLSSASFSGEASSRPVAHIPGQVGPTRSTIGLVALGIVAAGFVLRATAAVSSYLNTDEAFHYLLANQRSIGGYRVVSSKLWFFDIESFRSEFKRMKRSYGLKDGERVWIVEIGWGKTVYSLLAKRLSDIQGAMFGENLAVFPILTGPG